MEIRRNDNRDELLKQRLDRFNLSTRTENCLHSANVRTVAALVSLRSTDVLRWPRAGKKTLTELKLLLGRVGLKFSDDRAPLHVIEELSSKESSMPIILEEELYGFVKEVETDRNTELLMKLWGWNEEAPRTLDSVGREFALTRERVRQIEKRALQRLRKSRFDAPLVRAAIGALRNATPDCAVALSAKLRQLGISRSEFSVEGLRVAAQHLGIMWPLEIINVGDKQVFSIIGEGEEYRQAVILLRKMTSDRGCTSVMGLAFDLNLDESKIPSLRRVLDVVSEVEWLDDAREWLYSAGASRNRLYNLCSKVLSVTSRVHLSELRRAVSKSRRMAMCPPQHILGSFIERCGVGCIEESIVIGKLRSEVLAPAEGSAEGRMLRVLDEHGPVMEGEEFAEKCIAAGMNATTFYIYLGISPVICALGKSVYCKVGTEVPAGTVEDIVRRRQPVERVSDHGWTSAGRLWFGIELTRIVITSGGIRLPEFVADFVQGEWSVTLPDGSAYGTVTCREIFMWSFAKQFIALGAEPTDLTAFEFELRSRQVMVTVGGPGLFDAIQDTDTTILEDGLEEV